MTTQFIVFDIETAPLDWDSFSHSQQDYILRNATTEEEIAKRKFELGLSPMTAQVCCIGLQRVEYESRENWQVKTRLALTLDKNMEDGEYSDIEIANGDKCRLSNEKYILKYFWEILEKYKNSTLVSFNGRNFDAPFLMLRSAIHRIRPTRNLMQGTKYNYQLHTDLIDELTFFNPSFSYGATKRFNFDFYAHAFGIESPKAQGVDGSMVGELFNEGKVIEIAEYCMRDIHATWELYCLWNEYLKLS